MLTVSKSYFPTVSWIHSSKDFISTISLKLLEKIISDFHIAKSSGQSLSYVTWPIWQQIKELLTPTP